MNNRSQACIDNIAVRTAYHAALVAGLVLVPRDLEEYIEGYYNMSAKLKREGKIAEDFEPPADKTLYNYRQAFKRASPGVIGKDQIVPDNVEVLQPTPRHFHRQPSRAA